MVKLKYELIEFNCPKCGKYNNVIEEKMYDSDFVVCSTCNTKLDIDFELDKDDNITKIIVTEFEE
jgi:transcription elongation factor Elf1